MTLLFLWGLQWRLARIKEQPIAFSHRIHVGQRQISCAYCHTGVENGDAAGVIAVQDCMQCHQVVATNHPEIQKLAAYWERKKPIVWFKVYQVPKHVHFSHKAHIRFGFKCEECHGSVSTMSVIERAHNPSMGFCIDCHIKYAGKQLAPDKPLAPSRQQLLDCTTCHR